MRRLVRAVGLLVAVATLAMVVSFGASASHSDIVDPDDTRGWLDVRRVTTDGGNRAQWKVVTWGSWQASQIWDAGYVTINLDTFGTPTPDYYILVGSVGTHLFGELWRDRVTKRDFRVSGVRVWRDARNSLSARIPLAKMTIGDRRVAYTWYVETLFTSDSCRRVCFDHVPDQGVVTEPLPVVTPTVTPTPAPTASPTPSMSPTGSPSGSPAP